MDYQNFKAYLKTPSYPSHMDYMNSDYAPNLFEIHEDKDWLQENKFLLWLLERY
nr:hypothetical protein [uncultured Prevotella sp.]